MNGKDYLHQFRRGREFSREGEQALEGLFNRLNNRNQDPIEFFDSLREFAVSLRSGVNAATFANPKAIKIWSFEDAPTQWQFGNGDQDWVVFIPEGLDHPYWLDHSSFGEFFETEVQGGTVLVGCHA
jgi:hypothetical protein